VSGVCHFARPNLATGIYDESFFNVIKPGDLVLPVRHIVVDSVVPGDVSREPIGPEQTFTFTEDPPVPCDLPHTD
jgi:hypothetical protein